MSQELLYTSAPRGLKPGSRGFCTVLSTQGMAAPLATALEGLSGYRPLYPAGDDRAARNPVVYSHLKLQVGGRVSSVLSRIADFGLDYSQRANKLAHHVVLDKSELSSGDPASLLSMPGFMREKWEGEPKVVALKPVKPKARPPIGVCRAWQELVGDAGWAGVLAESFLRDPERLVVLLFAPGQDILPLFIEAMSLLPPERRWDVTFSTYFTGLAPATTCVWRAMIHDSKEAHESLRFVNALRLDLTSGSLGPATGGALVEAARSGVRPNEPRKRVASSAARAEEQFADLGTDEEFVELEVAHVEFAPYESPVSVSRPPELPQPPLRLPDHASAPPKKRRTLADLNEEEARRPSRFWLWMAITAVVLLMATSFGFAIATGRIDLAKLLTKSTSPQALADGPSPAPSSPDDTPKQTAVTRTSPVTSVTPTGESVHSQPLSAEQSTPVPVPAESTTTTVHSPPEKIAGPMAQTTPKLIDGNPSSVPSSGQPTPQVLGIPANGHPIELHSFSYLRPQQQAHAQMPPMPGMLLLKPSWLPYFELKPTQDQVNKHNAAQAVVETITFGEQAIALFTFKQRSLGDSQSFLLKSLKDDKVKWLGWYCVQVNSPMANGPPNLPVVKGPPIKLISFTRFPLDPTELKRDLKSTTPVRWLLPKTAPVDSTRVPKLVLDRLAVSIQERVFELDFPDREAKSAWNSSCTKFGSSVYKAFGIAKTKSELSLRLDVTIEHGTDQAAVLLKLVGKEKFIKPIEDDLAVRLFAEKSQLAELLAKIDAESKSQFDEKLKGLSVDSEAAVERVREIKKIIKDASDRASKQIDSAKDGRLKELTEIVSKLPSLVSLYDAIEQYRHLVDSLDKVKIVSARIYYELEDTKKTTKITVDVVNFDDSAKSDAKSEGDKQ